MAIRTKRWDEAVEDGDGFRLLVCRWRPRGVAKADEPWDEWWADLAPSRALLDAFHGKKAPPIDWETYAARYLDEMRGAASVWRIRDLRRRSRQGETITLLCSSACKDPKRCHRTLLARILEQPERSAL